MNPTATIETLRSLRLSGMADVYEASLRFAGSESPTPGELIARMAEAEWNLRQQRKTDRLLRQSTLRVPATLDSLSFGPERNLNRDTIATLSTMDWIKDGASILVTGPTGVGKSFIACAFGHEACQKGISTRYHPAIKLFPELRMARLDGSYHEKIARLRKTALLIIDDFALQPLNGDDRLALLEILDDRYNRSATIIASQLPVSKWHELIGEPTIADAVMDRLAHTPWIFELKGGSRRAKTGA